MIVGKLFSVAITVAAIAAAVPAQADPHHIVGPQGPVQWCNPASPLFDPTICYNESPHGGYACDPYGPAYDPNYCATQSKR